MAKSKITLGRVAPFFEDERAGERVDAVLSKLILELQNFKAPDAAAIGGTPAGNIGSSGIFYQTFETPVTTWTKRTDAGAVTYPSNGAAGGKAFNSAGGESFYEFPENVPFNPDNLYRMRARVRMTVAPTDSAKDLIYVGVQGIGSDGLTVVDTSGGTDSSLAHYVCIAAEDMGARTLNTWYTFTGYFQGTNATATGTTPSTDSAAPRLLDEDVRYIRPCFRLNAAAGDGTMEIDYVSLEILTEAVEANELLADVVDLGTGKVATGKVVAGSISVTDIASISANIGTITAGLLQNASGTRYIDLDATGANSFIEHDNFTLKADGTAIFGGSSLTASAITADGSLTVLGGLVGTGKCILDGAGFAGRMTATASSGGTTGAIMLGAQNNGGSIYANASAAAGGSAVISINSTPGLGFYGTGATAKQTVTGSRAGNAALASLLTALAAIGLITDSSS